MKISKNPKSTLKYLILIIHKILKFTLQLNTLLFSKKIPLLNTLNKILKSYINLTN